jgi:hypothetical protein
MKRQVHKYYGVQFWGAFAMAIASVLCAIWGAYSGNGYKVSAALLMTLISTGALIRRARDVHFARQLAERPDLKSIYDRWVE